MLHSSETRLSEILDLSYDYKLMKAYYEKDYELISLGGDAADIAEEYSGEYEKIEIDDNPTIKELLSVIPVSPFWEYGGYFNDGCLFSLKCDETSCRTPHFERMTFHTHPTASEFANVPSPNDLYFFLHYPNAVALTVGRSICWFMVKTAKTMDSVKRLAKWKEANMLRVLLDMHDKGLNTDEEIRAKTPEIFLTNCFEIEYLENIKTNENFDWAKIVREQLGIELLVFLPLHRSRVVRRNCSKI